MVNYKGAGDFAVRVDVQRSVIGYVRTIATVIALFTLAEFCIFYFSKKPEKKSAALFLTITAFAAFMPYLLYGIKDGHDFSWHFLRIEGLAQELKNGQFPVYMQSMWMNGYGCPVSVFYGDFLLYIPAVLRLLGFSFNTSYKVFVLLINFFTAVFSLYAFKKLFKKKYIAYVLTFVYICAPYRLVDIYVRFAVGEYSAIMFLPLVWVGFYEIVTEKADRKSALLLGLGMAGIVCSHTLTAEMTVTILLIACIVLYKRVCTWQCIKTLGIAVIYCLLAGAFYIVPFLDSYIGNDITIKYYTKYGVAFIQSAGAAIGQYFAAFQNVMDTAGSGSRLGDGMYLSIGLPLMGALLSAVLVLCRKKEADVWPFIAG